MSGKKKREKVSAEFSLSLVNVAACSFQHDTVTDVWSYNSTIKQQWVIFSLDGDYHFLTSSEAYKIWILYLKNLDNYAVWCYFSLLCFHLPYISLIIRLQVPSFCISCINTALKVTELYIWTYWHYNNSTGTTKLTAFPKVFPESSRTLITIMTQYVVHCLFRKDNFLNYLSSSPFCTKYESIFMKILNNKK